MNKNPEIGATIETGSFATNYHDIGSGHPVLLLHGSGPGVSAWANWRLTMQSLAPEFRCVAPDLAGFGYSMVDHQADFNNQYWMDQIITLLDRLELESVHVIGNSFGGSLALALAIAAPERVKKLVLMGSVGIPFELTKGLDAVWGYEPSMENMRAIMSVFAFDQTLLGDELVRMRYEASIRPGIYESYSRMFPAPRQRWVDAMSHSESEIRSIAHSTLLVHGRDDKVIPVSNSKTLLDWIHNSQLHVYGRCGHWTQIERRSEFPKLVSNFLHE